MKTMRTIFVLLVVTFAMVLWWTRHEDYPSQSSMALAINSHWYYMMHISILFTFVTDWMINQKNYLNWLPAVGAGLVMYFDMYSNHLAHNWSTAFLMAGAVSSLIVHAANKQERIYMIVLCFCGAVMFPLGLFTHVRLFHAETIAEILIGVGMMRRIWLDRGRSR